MFPANGYGFTDSDNNQQQQQSRPRQRRRQRLVVNDQDDDQQGTTVNADGQPEYVTGPPGNNQESPAIVAPIQGHSSYVQGPIGFVADPAVIAYGPSNYTANTGRSQNSSAISSGFGQDPNNYFQNPSVDGRQQQQQPPSYLHDSTPFSQDKTADIQNHTDYVHDPSVSMPGSYDYVCGSSSKGSGSSKNKKPESGAGFNQKDADYLQSDSDDEHLIALLQDPAANINEILEIVPELAEQYGNSSTEPKPKVAPKPSEPVRAFPETTEGQIEYLRQLNSSYEYVCGRSSKPKKSCVSAPPLTRFEPPGFIRNPITSMYGPFDYFAALSEIGQGLPTIENVNGNGNGNGNGDGNTNGNGNAQASSSFAQTSQDFFQGRPLDLQYECDFLQNQMAFQNSSVNVPGLSGYAGGSAGDPSMNVQTESTFEDSSAEFIATPTTIQSQPDYVQLPMTFAQIPTINVQDTSGDVSGPSGDVQDSPATPTESTLSQSQAGLLQGPTENTQGKPFCPHCQITIPQDSPAKLQDRPEDDPESSVILQSPLLNTQIEPRLSPIVTGPVPGLSVIAQGRTDYMQSPTVIAQTPSATVHDASEIIPAPEDAEILPATASVTANEPNTDTSLVSPSKDGDAIPPLLPKTAYKDPNSKSKKMMPCKSAVAFMKRRNAAQHVIEGLRDFLHVLAPDGRFLYVSPSTKMLTGYMPKDLLGKLVSDFVHPDDKGLFMCEFQEAMATSKSIRFFYRFCRKDCTYAIFETHGHPHMQEAMEAFGPNPVRLCRGFFMVARPYPTKNSALMDTFLEHKIRNIALNGRVAALTKAQEEGIDDDEDDDDDGESTTTGTTDEISSEGSQVANMQPPDLDPSMRLQVLPSGTVLMPAPLNRRLRRMKGRQPLIEPEVESTDKIEKVTEYPCDDNYGHYDTVELMTGLRYREGERSQGISTGDVCATLIPGSVGFATSVDKEGRGSSGRKRLKNADDYVCTDCGTLDSPEWRRGPSGPKTLCNACGLRWSKQEKKRQKQAALEQSILASIREPRPPMKLPKK